MNRLFLDCEEEQWKFQPLVPSGANSSQMKKRPTSAVGYKRPISQYARVAMAMGSHPRYRAENIMFLELDVSPPAVFEMEFSHDQDQDPVHYTWRGSCGWTAFWKDLPRLKSGSPDPGARVLSGLHLPPHTPRWPPLLLCAPRQCSTTSDHLPSGLPVPRPDPQGRGGQPWLISLPLGVRACVCVCGRMCVCVCWGDPGRRASAGS